MALAPCVQIELEGREEMLVNINRMMSNVRAHFPNFHLKPESTSDSAVSTATPSDATGGGLKAVSGD
jgi:hypothetical protein